MDKNFKPETENTLLNKFQSQTSKSLIRHKSILDIMTKLDEYNSRINRAVAKSVTNCGCISINAKKQNFDGKSYDELIDKVDSHLEGSICNHCQEILESEIGSYTFYLASLSNTLELDLSEIVEKEYNLDRTLGIFSLK